MQLRLRAYTFTLSLKVNLLCIPFRKQHVNIYMNNKGKNHVFAVNFHRVFTHLTTSTLWCTDVQCCVRVNPFILMSVFFSSHAALISLQSFTTLAWWGVCVFYWSQELCLWELTWATVVRSRTHLNVLYIGEASSVKRVYDYNVSQYYNSKWKTTDAGPMASHDLPKKGVLFSTLNMVKQRTVIMFFHCYLSQLHNYEKALLSKDEHMTHVFSLAAHTDHIPQTIKDCLSLWFVVCIISQSGHSNDLQSHNWIQ